MNEKRARIWAVTINAKANCYNSLDDCLGTIIGANDKYAYIRHDKDTEINEETGEEKPKAEHIHLLLTFKNARGFNSIKKTFDGAHIETALGESAYANYLLHNGKPQKYHYNAEEVITNNRTWYNSLLTIKAKETFIEDKLPYYILVDGDKTYLALCLRFGAKQLPYGIDYKTKAILKDYEELEQEEKNKVLILLQEQYGDDDLPF